MMSRPCVRCEKGVGIFLCSGCEHSFCRKHSDEHRQELSCQLDELTQQFNGFQQYLFDPNDKTSPIKRIDQWEIESIDQIRRTAAKAREYLQKSIERVQVELNPVKHEIKEKKETESFTEHDINRWIEQLKIQQNSFQTLMNDFFPFNEEKFAEADEAVELFENQYVAQSKENIGESLLPVFGTMRYSNGVHFRRFRIEKLLRRCIAIGVSSATVEGQGAFEIFGGFHALVCGTLKMKDPEILSRFIQQEIETDDEIDVTINCNQSLLVFRKATSNERFELPVNQVSCPLPWKITIVLFGPGSRLRILR